MNKKTICMFLAFFTITSYAKASTFSSSMTSSIVVGITDTGFGFFNNIIQSVVTDQLMQNYLDLMLRDMTDDTDNYNTTICYCWEGQKCEKDTGDCNTTACPNAGNCETGSPGAAYGGSAKCDGGADDYAYCTGWEYSWLLDTCLSLPLVGDACFAIRLGNIDSDPWVAEFNYTCANVSGIQSSEGGNNEPNTCVPYDTASPYDDDDAMQLTLELKDIEVELEFGRPWADVDCQDPTNSTPGCYASPPAGWQNIDQEWLSGPASTRCDDYIYARAHAGTSLVCNSGGTNPCCSGITATVNIAPALTHRQLDPDPHIQELNICAGDIGLTFSLAYDWTTNHCTCSDGSGCSSYSGTNVCVDTDQDGRPDITEWDTAATTTCSDNWCDCDVSDDFPAMLPFIDAQFSAWFDDTISSALDYYVGCAKAFDLTSTLQNPYYNTEASPAQWEGGITHPIGSDYIGFDIAADAWYCYRPWGGSNNGGIIIGRANIDTYWLNALNVDPRVDTNWVCDPCYDGAGSAGSGACDGTTANDQCYLASMGYTEVTNEYNPVIVQPTFTGNSSTEWNKLPFTANTVGGQAYDVGIGIHEQVLSEAIYEVLRDGILSLVLDRDTPSIGEMLTSVLNTDIFGFFLPDLSAKEPGRDMRIAIVPIFDDTVATDKHRAYSTDDVAQIQRADGTYLQVAQDIAIDMPRVYLDFWVDRQKTGSGWQKIFRMDVQMFLGLGLEILACTAADVSNGICNNTTTSFKLSAGLVIDPWVNDIVETSNTIYQSSEDYQDFMGDILPIILSGIIGANINVTLDLFPIFDPANISIRAPSIGAAGENVDTASTGDASAGDYFAMYLKLWESGVYGDNIDAKFILDILEGHNDLFGSIGLPFAPPVNVSKGPVKIEPYYPDTVITEFKQLDDRTFGVYFTGYDDKTPLSDLEFAYRVDNGVWSPFFKSDSVAFKIMREGNHTVEVMAKDTSGYADPVPAKYTFRVDRVGPHLSTYQGIPREIPYGDPLVFDIYAKDFQAPDNKVLTSYKLDKSEWSKLSHERHIEISDLSLGKHILKIRGYDDLGNMSEISYEFNVVMSEKGKDNVISSGFGCSTVEQGSIETLCLIIFMVFVPALVFRKLWK